MVLSEMRGKSVMKTSSYFSMLEDCSNLNLVWVIVPSALRFVLLLVSLLHKQRYHTESALLPRHSLEYETLDNHRKAN